MGCSFQVIDGEVRIMSATGEIISSITDGSIERLAVDIGSVSLDATQLPNEPPSGWISWHVLGYNSDIDSSPVMLWDGPTDSYPFQTSAAMLNVKSSSSSDDLGSIGAEKVTIEGLDSSYNIQTEEVTMNGTTNAATTKSYIAFNHAYVSDAGSAGNNVGNITFTHTGSSDVIGYMKATHSYTNQAVRTVPNGYKFRLMRIWGSAVDSSSPEGAVALYTKQFGEGNIKDYSLGLSHGASSFVDLPMMTARDYPAKTEMYMEWDGDDDDIKIHGGIEGWLIPIV